MRGQFPQGHPRLSHETIEFRVKRPDRKLREHFRNIPRIFRNIPWPFPVEISKPSKDFPQETMTDFKPARLNFIARAILTNTLVCDQKIKASFP